MRKNGVIPDKHTFPLLLKTLSKFDSRVLQVQRQNPFFLLYPQIIKFGFGLDRFVRNALISAFAGSGFMDSARRVFDEIETSSSSSPDVVAWTSLIDGYVKNDNAGEALRLFSEMRSTKTGIDGVTIVSVLRAAGILGDVFLGRWIHGFYVEAGRVQLDAYVSTALVDMYFKCGHCEDAHKVFDEMPSSHKNVVSWTALINGYVQSKRFKDALVVFQNMLSQHNIVPNHFTLTSALHASAHIGGLEQGKLIHQYIDKNKVSLNSSLATALINMYAKCGCINEALLLFERLPEEVKNVYTWTAMINGLAVNGDALRSLEIFSCMLRNGVEPTEVTFIGVLSACSHGGLVDEGRRLFKMMKDAYQIEPNMDHYGCMVDVLGRAGYLEDAKKMIDEMPMKPSFGVLGTLLGACIMHKNSQMGEDLGNYLINLEADDDHSGSVSGGAYALLANLYSMSQKWEEAGEVRKMMKGKGVEKTPGYSWIQVNGVIHEFKAFDHSHKESCSVYWILDNLLFQLKVDVQTQEKDFFGQFFHL